jgi:acetyltransferase-like isoleucine patch superfamily enzyme
MSINLVAGYRKWTRLRDRMFTWACRGSFGRLGKGTLLELPIRLWGEARMEIGADVFMGSHCWLQVISADEPGSGTVISIGDRTSISGFCTVTAARSVVIEPGVLMARYVYISDHTHEYDSPARPIKDQGITGIAPVRVCEGAWLGQGVVVCPGVTIGRNAVVGANSVVRDDVPDFCVAVGAPARVVRQLNAAPRPAAPDPARAFSD